MTPGPGQDRTRTRTATGQDRTRIPTGHLQDSYSGQDRTGQDSYRTGQDSDRTGQERIIGQDRYSDRTGQDRIPGPGADDRDRTGRGTGQGFQFHSYLTE